MSSRQHLFAVCKRISRQPRPYKLQTCGSTLMRHLTTASTELFGDATINSTELNMLHTPVLVDTVVDLIKPEKHQTILDLTFGAGGHTKALLQKAPEAHILALDRDPQAHQLAIQLAETKSNVTPLLGCFSELPSLLAEHGKGVNSIDAALIDAGASSMQFDGSTRGFALSKDGPLDMRMDGSRGQITAADVVNNMAQSDLYKIIKKYGEEKHARLIARTIVDSRYSFGKITSTKQLADVISSAFNGKYRTDKLMRKSHVATKTFQALRIFVNNELNELHNGLTIVHKLLKPGGICVALTFHSLEDRIVKRHFHGIDMDEKFNMGISGKFRSSAKIHNEDVMDSLLSKQWSWEPVSRRVTTPSEQQIEENPRARSAKLRAGIKL